jgi:hypothetical protein
LVKKGNTLIGIDPSFEYDTNVVSVPPNEAAFANCEKVVKRNVEDFRKKSQFVRMQSSASPADLASDAGAHFSRKEKQSTD